MVDDSLINRRGGGEGGGSVGIWAELFRSEEILGQFLKVHT